LIQVTVLAVKCSVCTLFVSSLVASLSAGARSVVSPPKMVYIIHFPSNEKLVARCPWRANGKLQAYKFVGCVPAVVVTVHGVAPVLER
jgi:hypothetical protein